MTNILLDTNIILDIALKRQPFFESSSKIFLMMDQNILSSYVTATTITDIYYIARKEKSRNIAREFIINLVSIVDVLGVDQYVIHEALQRDMKDFEDAIQVSAADLRDIKSIVTRNPRDFNNCGLEVYTPDELIETIGE